MERLTNEQIISIANRIDALDDAGKLGQRWNGLIHRVAREIERRGIRF